MKYREIKSCAEEEFVRLTGIKKTTFAKMVDVLVKAAHKQKSRGGKPTTLVMAYGKVPAIEL